MLSLPSLALSFLPFFCRSAKLPSGKSYTRPIVNPSSAGPCSNPANCWRNFTLRLLGALLNLDATGALRNDSSCARR